MEITQEERLLLSDAINLRKRYKLVDTLNAKPFNIFYILRSERNERFTHSAFVAELLNPKGTHCQGSLFLKLFLNEFEWPEFTERYLEKTIVKVEHHVGNGFIDIWIDFGNASICVENKIDATDQENQLSRYNDYCVKCKKPYKIIYLTLDGHESPDTKYTKGNKFEYIQWSYEFNIISWLDNCIKESARIPVLRETIYQYQQLLKKLCGRLQNENEAMELNELLKSSREQFEAANNIHEQFKTAKYQVKLNFWKEIESYFAEKYKEDFEVEFSFGRTDSYPKIIIGHKFCEEWYVCFAIEYLQRETYYGIYSYAYDKRKPKEKELIKSYKELNLTDYRKSDWWLAYKYYDNINFVAMETLSRTFLLDDKKALISEIVEPIDILIEEYGDRLLEINKEIHNKLTKL